MADLAISAHDLSADATAAYAGGLRFAALAPEEASAFRGKWSSLAENAAAGDNVFFHPDFVLPAARYLGRRVRVAVAARDDGRVAALAPFRRVWLGGIAPAVRLWAHDYAPLGLPLVDGATVAAGVAALLDGLAPARSGVSLVVPDCDVRSSVAEALVNAARRQARPVVLLNAHERAMLARGADPVAALSGRRRRKFARQMEQLGAEGPVTFEAATAPHAVVRRFGEFLKLEAAGWKGKGRTALAAKSATAAFASEVVNGRAGAGAARIDSLLVGSKPIAMLVTLIVGSTAFTWKIAYDEGYARFSPGAQLMLNAASRIFADDRIARIDSCAAPHHPMVDGLWDDRLAVATLVIGPPGGGVVFAAGLAAARGMQAARARAKAMLRR